MWCIPPQQDAAFVAQMEQVLEVYKRPYDRRRPVVGMDEQSKQLISEVISPVPPAPGRPDSRLREAPRTASLAIQPGVVRGALEAPAFRIPLQALVVAI